MYVGNLLKGRQKNPKFVWEYRHLLYVLTEVSGEHTAGTELEKSQTKERRLLLVVAHHFLSVHSGKKSKGLRWA